MANQLLLTNLISARPINDADSEDELTVLGYLEELKANGYIREIYRAETIRLLNGVQFVISIGKKYKRKPKDFREPQKYVSMTEAVHYTPDFIIIWEEKAKDKFFISYGHWDEISKIPEPLSKPKSHFLFTAKKLDDVWVSVIDVKPSCSNKFTRYSSSDTFSVKQALLLEIHDLYVQKVTYKSLFKLTFTPNSYRYTPVTKKLRTIKEWTPISLEVYENKIDQYCKALE